MNAALLHSLKETPSRLELWDALLQEAAPATMAEVGVWKGDFAARVLERNPGIQRYYMLDPWANLPDWNKPANVAPEEFTEIYDEAMAKTAFAQSRITVLRGRTKEVCHEIPDASLDIAYIDGDHTLRGITIDLVQMLPKVKPGGLLTGDDFSRTPWQHKAKFEPTLVCPFAVYFAEAMNLPIYGLPHKQFLIINDPSRGFSFTDIAGIYGDLSLNKLHPDQVPKKKRL